MLHYPFYFRLDGTDGFLIWHTDGVGSLPDTFECVDSRFVACFRDLATLLRFADVNSIGTIVDDVPVVHEMDAALSWVKNPTSTTEHCQNALGVWNLFIDLGATLPNQCGQLKSEIDNALAIEQKLFFGSNLPSITPEGEHYEPNWETEEKTILHSVFTRGTDAFRQSITIPRMA